MESEVHRLRTEIAQLKSAVDALTGRQVASDMLARLIVVEAFRSKAMVAALARALHNAAATLDQADTPLGTHVADHLRSLSRDIRTSTDV